MTAHGLDTAAILATAVVPWTAQLELDEACFRRQVCNIAGKLTPHIYVFGTAGEGYGVNERQFRQIAMVFWNSVQTCQASPMLGIISLSLGTIIERIEFGRAFGYRKFLLSLPAWGALNDHELDRFFAETCGRFTDCWFLHYNLGRSGSILGVTEYRQLIERHPIFVAVKTDADDPIKIREMLSLAPRLRFFFTEFGYAAGKDIGPCGLLISLASVNHARAHEFLHCDAARRDEFLKEMQAMADTSLRLGAGRFHMDGAYGKLLYRMNDPAFPLRLLPPYEGANDEDAAVFRSRLPVSWARLDTLTVKQWATLIGLSR